MWLNGVLIARLSVSPNNFVLMSSITRPRRSVNRADNEDDDIILTSKESLTNKDTDLTKARRCKFVYKTILLLLRNITVEPVMFLFMFGTYLYLALIELYIYQQYGLKALENINFNMPNHSFCVNAMFLDRVVGNGTNDRVESEASLLILTISATGQVISVFVALVAGPLSDRYGRKPMLFFALTGNLIGAVLNIFIVYFHLDMHSLIASGLVLGITGGFSVVMTVCVAYVADVSTTKWLTLRIALLQAMLYTSQALSDVITGQWLKRSGCFFDPLLWLSAAAGLLVLFYLIILKEPWSRKARLAKLKANGEEQIASLLTRGFKIFLYRGYSRWRLWLTLITMSITVINGIGMFEILTLFQVHEPLNWDPAEIGWYGLASTLAQAFSLFFILPVVVFFRIPDPLIVLVGLVITSGMYFFIGFLRESWEMYLGNNLCILI